MSSLLFYPIYLYIIIYIHKHYIYILISLQLYHAAGFAAFGTGNPNPTKYPAATAPPPSNKVNPAENIFLPPTSQAFINPKVKKKNAPIIVELIINELSLKL